MSAVPVLVLQLGFDSPQPYLGGLVYSALVDTSEKLQKSASQPHLHAV